jgi:SNF2 family DNA or RNA helicase
MPTSLIPNWLDEAERFTPQLRVLALHGAGRRRDFARIAEHDLILTTMRCCRATPRSSANSSTTC